MTICNKCNRYFLKDLGGNMCPRCEDKFMDARDIIEEEKKARGEL